MNNEDMLSLIGLYNQLYNEHMPVELDGLLKNKRILIICSSNQKPFRNFLCTLGNYENHFFLWASNLDGDVKGCLDSDYVTYLYHEGRFDCNNIEFKIVSQWKYDAILYFVNQPDLIDYLNVEAVCEKLTKNTDATIYMMDQMGKLFILKDITKYIMIKRLIVAYINYKSLKVI